MLAWFDEIGSNIAAEFLERWPSLDKLQRARPATIGSGDRPNKKAGFILAEPSRHAFREVLTVGSAWGSGLL